jgi:signal transduction histidine kinase
MSQAPTRRDVDQLPELNDTKAEADRLTAANEQLKKEIAERSGAEDLRGRGMSADVLSSVTSGSGAPGVGLAGMRERLQQLGGALHIESSDRGTTLRAAVRLPAHLS